MHTVQAKALLTKWNGMNIYRGCVHGCIYCDSRSDCYHFTHPFEDIEVKENAPELLERILRSRKKKTMIGSGSMADPYQPCERELCLMRRCLEVIEKNKFGATLITKSDLVLRDLDLLERIRRKTKCVVQMTLTTADEALCKRLEPNVCTTARRFEVLKELQRRGIPTVVWLSPFLPFINDTEENVKTLLELCIDAGVKGVVCFNIGMTLRSGDREYYYRALDRLFPGLSDTYRAKYGNAYEVVSDRSEALMPYLHERMEQYGILHTPEDCFRYTATLPERYEQLSLFS